MAPQVDQHHQHHALHVGVAQQVLHHQMQQPVRGGCFGTSGRGRLDHLDAAALERPQEGRPGQAACHPGTLQPRGSGSV